MTWSCWARTTTSTPWPRRPAPSATSCCPTWAGCAGGAIIRRTRARRSNTMQLSRYAVGSVGEEAFGFCQAVRRGPHVAVSGSTGRDVDGRIVPGGAYAQARQAIENLQTALAAVGGSLADVIRTRVFIVDITEWEAIA